jgi:hypothetical protein
METNLSYITLALAAATLLVTIYLAFRLKAALYLLQQPVVKKMSPQLRLKPVKLDEAMDRNRNRGDRGPRPEGRDGERGREGGRDGERRDRGPRPEGERREGGRDRRDGDRRDGRREGERGPRPEGDRGPRPEGRDGGRDRRDGDRRDGRREGERGRDGRREGGERREFSEARESAPAAPSPDFSAPSAEAPAGLPPRRPLPSFNDAPSDRHEEASAPARESSSNDGFVGGNSDDMQHGRRTQLKKKPRFDFDEEETPAT